MSNDFARRDLARPCVVCCATHAAPDAVHGMCIPEPPYGTACDDADLQLVLSDILTHKIVFALPAATAVEFTSAADPDSGLCQVVLHLPRHFAAAVMAHADGGFTYTDVAFTWRMPGLPDVPCDVGTQIRLLRYPSWYSPEQMAITAMVGLRDRIMRAMNILREVAGANSQLEGLRERIMTCNITRATQLTALRNLWCALQITGLAIDHNVGFVTDLCTCPYGFTLPMVARLLHDTATAEEMLAAGIDERVCGPYGCLADSKHEADEPPYCLWVPELDLEDYSERQQDIMQRVLFALAGKKGTDGESHGRTELVDESTITTYSVPVPVVRTDDEYNNNNNDVFAGVDDFDFRTRDQHQYQHQPQHHDDPPPDTDWEAAYTRISPPYAPMSPGSPFNFS